MKNKIASIIFTALILAGLSTGKVFAHEHHAPHGGTLIELGEEFAHVELVLDKQSGKLSGFVLDGEAENPVRIQQDNLEFQIKTDKGPLILSLLSQANPLTGEEKGDTSEFSVQNDTLKGMEKFEGVLTSISVKGQDFKNVDFKYPEGNE